MSAFFDYLDTEWWPTWLVCAVAVVIIVRDQSPRLRRLAKRIRSLVPVSRSVPRRSWL